MNKKYQKLLSFKITPQSFFGKDGLERIIILVGDMIYKTNLIKEGCIEDELFQYRTNSDGAYSDRTWLEFVKNTVMEYDSEGISVYTGSRKDIDEISFEIKGENNE